jgi:pantetheine-phosphate adenylyltransferase
MELERVAVYAGSFDPVTKGHVDIIHRASHMFDKIVVGILNNTNKSYWFNLDERKHLLEKVVKDMENVEIQCFQGLLVDFMKKNNSDIIVRGLRAVSDYEYELQIALANKSLSGGKIETIFLPASRENLYISSSIVREIASFGGNLKEFVDEDIIEDLKNKIKRIEKK